MDERTAGLDDELVDHVDDDDVEIDLDADLDVTRFVQGMGLKTEAIPPGQTEHFTITDVGWKVFEGKNGKPSEKKPLLTLDDDREWSLNIANAGICRDAWGPDMRKWIGHRIGAYHDRSVTDPNGRRSGGLRVRIPESDQ